MKKVVILTLCLVAFTATVFAQNSKSFYRSSYESRNSGSFDQGHSLLTVGYGFANQFYPSGYTSNRFALGPVYVKYEHGFLRDEIGLGGHIAIANGWARYYVGQNKYTQRTTAASFAVLGYYHFNKLIPVQQLDVYAGAGLSFWTASYHYDYNNVSNGDNNVYAVVKVGARYYVKPKLGLYGEVGYDQMSSLNLGVTFKL